VSYVLLKNVARKLAQPLPEIDPDVARISVDIAPDHNGEDMLFFRVVLKDDTSLAAPSAALGKRLNKIAAALRMRAAKEGLPMFASVGFMAESELPRQRRRKTA